MCILKLNLSVKGTCFIHTGQVTEGKGRDWENGNHSLQEKIRFETIKEPEDVQVTESLNGMG